MLEQMSNKYTIHTVKNAIQILKSFTKENTEMTLSDISRLLDLNISTTNRLVKTLENYDYLQRDPKTKRYRLGYMLLNLSGIITTTMEIHREAKPILEDLVKDLDEAIHLGVLEGIDIVYLDKLEKSSPIRLNSYIGKRNPSYCTGCGKVMLAFQRQDKLTKLIERIEKNGFIQYGKNTVTDSETLMEQLIEIREKGVAICIDEYYEGINIGKPDGVLSIGAPVYDYTEEVIAAISVTGRMKHITEERIPYYTEQVVQAAKKISKKLGHYY